MNEILYWSPFISKVATIKSVINSADAVNNYLSNKYKAIIIKKLKNKIKQCDLVVLSDYNKGLLDEDLIKKIIKLCIQYNKIIIADPKKIDLNCLTYIEHIN